MCGFATITRTVSGIAEHLLKQHGRVKHSAWRWNGKLISVKLRAVTVTTLKFYVVACSRVTIVKTVTWYTA